jgi:homopolymeric O-antigen transport system permease protein
MTFPQYYRLINLHARMLLKTDASKFKLGFLWWFLEPLMWVGVFYVVFNLILDSRKGGEFLVFLSCGKFAFLWFSKTMMQASNSIVSSKGLVGKINVPKSVWPMSAIQESVYRQASVYLLLFVILALFGIFPNLTWLWMLPVILVMYLMIVAAGLAGAILVCLVRDFQKFIALAMTFLLFTSGIFWDVRDLGNEAKTELVLALNPLAFMLDAHRQILMYNIPPAAGHLALIGLGSLAFAALMFWLLRRYSQFLALKVLT